MYCPRCGTNLPEQAVFCYKCGAKVGLIAQPQPASGGPGQVLAPGGATQLKCPSCGAPISPKFGEMIITCGYCGSSVSLANDGWKSIQKHTMLPLKFSDKDEVLKVVRAQVDRGLLHRHLMEQSTLEEMNLALVPYWLIPVSARTSLVAVDMGAEAGTIATTAVLAGMMGGVLLG